MNFAINIIHGTSVFNYTLLPTRFIPVFADAAKIDDKLSKFSEMELATIEAYLYAKADEHQKISELTDKPNEHGLSASAEGIWKSRCIAETNRMAAAGVRRFIFSRKNSHLRG